jgi:hypothetical protein
MEKSLYAANTLTLKTREKSQAPYSDLQTGSLTDDFIQ